MVGSIGVRALLMDFTKMFENEGVKAIPVDTGEFKSLGVAGLPITEKQIAHVQLLVDQNFKQFIDAVVRGRPTMNEEQVRAVADGRMFMANDALKAGMIDGIQTLGDTLASLQVKKDNRDATRAAKTTMLKHKRKR